MRKPEPAEPNEAMPMAPAGTGSGRRRFVIGLGTLIAAAATRASAPPRVQAQTPPAKNATTAKPATVDDGEGVVQRMQRELALALRKPMAERRWVMVIDVAKCTGCTSCTIACKAENKLPPGVVYRPVLDIETGTYPNVSRRFLPRPCMQCDNPPCTKVCPVGATYKRPDGIVAIDYDRCIGCRYCLAACPYGARSFDFGEQYTDGTPAVQPYETLATFEYGGEHPREAGQSPIGNARKCHFCLHRLDAGMLPACVTTCLGRATYFGDANDPNSLVSELITSPRAMRLKEELGTHPNVYYLQ